MKFEVKYNSIDSKYMYFDILATDSYKGINRIFKRGERIAIIPLVKCNEILGAYCPLTNDFVDARLTDYTTVKDAPRVLVSGTKERGYKIRSYETKNLLVVLEGYFSLKDADLIVDADLDRMYKQGLNTEPYQYIGNIHKDIKITTDSAFVYTKFDHLGKCFFAQGEKIQNSDILTFRYGHVKTNLKPKKGKKCISL